MGTIPTAPIVVAGGLGAADDFNNLGKAVTFWSLAPRCYAYAASATSIAHSGTTPTVIALDAEVYDVANNYDGGSDAPQHDNTTNPTRIFIRTSGKYEITSQVVFNNNATGIRSAYVYKNAAGNPASGTQLTASTQSAVTAGFATAVVLPTIEVPLVAGDYLELFGLQNSGGALNVSTGQGATFLRMKLSGS